jgi:hypothetical protein
MPTDSRRQLPVFAVGVGTDRRRLARPGIREEIPSSRELPRIAIRNFQPFLIAGPACEFLVLRIPLEFESLIVKNLRKLR